VNCEQPNANSAYSLRPGIRQDKCTPDKCSLFWKIRICCSYHQIKKSPTHNILVTVVRMEEAIVCARSDFATSHEHIAFRTGDSPTLERPSPCACVHAFLLVHTNSRLCEHVTYLFTRWLPQYLSLSILKAQWGDREGLELNGPNHVLLVHVDCLICCLKIYCHILGVCVTYITSLGFDDRIYWTCTQLVTTFHKSLSSTGHSRLLTTLH
jgi:hypothetical protein